MFYFAKNILSNLKTCRCINFIFYGRQLNNLSFTKYVYSFLCGGFFGWLFWEFIIINFHVVSNFECYELVAVITLFGIAYMISTAVKCITLLIFVAIVGKSGRSYLRALCFAFVISGPIENLSVNGEEVVRIFACSTILSYNLSQTRFDLMTKPFQRTLASIKYDIKEIEQTFSEMTTILEPIRHEIEDDESELDQLVIDNQPRQRYQGLSTKAETVQTNYKNKLERRCKNQLGKGVSRCNLAFSKAYEQCLAKFPRILRSLLCWPFRVDFVCKDFLGNPDKVCDPSEALPRDFGENYINLLRTKDALYTANASDMKFKYNLKHSPIPPELNKPKQIAEHIIAEFITKKKSFDRIMRTMQRFLSFIYIKVIIASVIYYRKYITEIDFDNLYISEYFKRIDRKRRSLGKKYLLPLKKHERTNIADLANSTSLTKRESKTVVFHMLQLSLEIIAAGFFLFLDYLILTMMEIIRTKSELSFVQEGEHTIQFNITGAGLMARLMRLMLKNFNMHEHVSMILTNEDCLPNPRVLPKSYYIKLASLYVCIIILIYKSTYFLRLRRSICSNFYHKHEKKRTLYLYNNILRQRRLVFKMMERTAQANIAAARFRRKFNFVLNIRLKYSTYFDWLKKFSIGCHSCLICGSLEDSNFLVCSNMRCGLAYCDECWRDMKNFCLACKQQIKFMQIINLKSFFHEVV